MTHPDDAHAAFLEAACVPLDYQIVFAGNPDLDAEESESFNVGAAWQPSGMWRLSVDYWDIKQEDKIDEVPFGFIYNLECNNQASTVCLRGAPVGGNTLGPLLTLNSGFINIGEQSVNGIDLGANFAADLGPGTLSLGLENALDEEVPFAIGDADVDVYGYVQNLHSPRGRFAYGRATYRF